MAVPELFVSEVETPQVLKRTWSFEILNGPNAGQLFTPKRNPAVLGSSADADIQLRDGSISRFHAELDLEPDAVRLRDLGSALGCRVQHQRVHHARILPLSHFEAGNALIRARADDLPVQDPSFAELELGGLITRSPSTRRVAAWVQALAQQRAGVCFVGPPGSGRSAWARVLHNLGSDPKRPFIVHRTTKGRIPLFSPHGPFESSRGGTLVIDTPAGMPPAEQERLRTALDGVQAPRVVTIDVSGISDQLVVGLSERIGTVHLYLEALAHRPEDLRAYLTSRAQEVGLPNLGKQLKNWILNTSHPPGFEAIENAFDAGWPPHRKERSSQSALRSALLADLLEHAQGNVDEVAKRLERSSQSIFSELAHRKIRVLE